MISRRGFLQRAAATAVAMSLDPFQGVSTVGNVYKNSRLSLTLRKPIGWKYSSIADFAALRNKQVLEGILANEPHELRDLDVLPVFIFENDQYREGEFVPAICMYDNEHVEAPPFDQCAAHLGMIQRFSSVYKNLVIGQNPEHAENRYLEFTQAKWSYLHVLDDGATLPLLVTSLVIFHEGRVQTFYLVDHSDTPFIADHVWAGFIEDMKYESSALPAHFN